MSGHTYKIGDRIRVTELDPDDPDPPMGSTWEVMRTTEGSVMVSWRDGYWLRNGQIEPEPMSSRPSITGEAMAMSHGKPWQLRAVMRLGLTSSTLRAYADLLDGAVP
jgi:hypothetical protein